MNTTRFFVLASLVLAALPGCAHGARGATCTAYEAGAPAARSLCHRTCDLIPTDCPWAEDPE